MSNRLDRVTDWTALAVQCEFRLDTMARAMAVSERTLRRYFKHSFGITPKEWRDAKRLEIALANLCRGEQVKSTSGDAKFRHRETLSAFIKRHTGSPPTAFRKTK